MAEAQVWRDSRIGRACGEASVQLRSEMDSIGAEYGVDQAVTGSAQSRNEYVAHACVWMFNKS
jgi:hypothetical protein